MAEVEDCMFCETDTGDCHLKSLSLVELLEV
jgi:hypothetical protein